MVARSGRVILRLMIPSRHWIEGVKHAGTGIPRRRHIPDHRTSPKRPRRSIGNGYGRQDARARGAFGGRHDDRLARIRRLWRKGASDASAAPDRQLIRRRHGRAKSDPPHPCDPSRTSLAGYWRPEISTVRPIEFETAPRHATAVRNRPLPEIDPVAWPGLFRRPDRCGSRITAEGCHPAARLGAAADWRNSSRTPRERRHADNETPRDPNQAGTPYVA